MASLDAATELFTNCHKLLKRGKVMLNYWNFCKDKNSTITVFYLDPADLDKWLYQNKAEYTGSYVEGCLQDNFVVSTKRGYAFFYEHILNEWSSDFGVFFIPYKSGEKHMESYDFLWSEWFDFEQKAETA